MKRMPTVCLALFAALFGMGAFWPLPGGMLLGQAETPAAAESGFHYFEFMSSTSFSGTERVLLFVVLGVAFAGLAYAWMLMKQVNEADKGTPRMQEIAAAIREGADAYL